MKKIIVLLSCLALSSLVIAEPVVKVKKNGRVATNGVTAGQIIVATSFTNPNGDTKTRAEWQSQIGSEQITDGSIAASDLAADALPGADFIGSNQQENIDNTDEIIRSITISAPTSGVVIVNSTVYTEATSAGTLSRCSITTGSSLDINAFVSSSGASGTDSEFSTMSGTRGFNVDAGDFTVNLVCDTFTGTATLRDSHLTAMFFPKQY